MDNIAKTSMAVSQAFLAVALASMLPQGIGIPLGVLLAYSLVFY